MLIERGGSRSFPAPHPLLDAARDHASIALLIGEDAGAALAGIDAPGRMAAILIELGTECLAVHAGEGAANILGFARFRLGDDPPSDLVELVRQGATSASSLAAAQAFLDAAGLSVALCNDIAGRIIDRLVRPYFNAALTKLDEGLATAADLDLTVRLGLGYPTGPIALLERSGLAHHFDVSAALLAAYGEPAYAPARRARVAKERKLRGKD
ncbi:MAG TPA: 3-hydroxyacyl-CoA dehydrogenase family protein [Stellaceae bacterium]|nr:3-hydroxyacyl-CoA dehydrogenase family protein [Stellaceae bacterium]